MSQYYYRECAVCGDIFIAVKSEKVCMHCHAGERKAPYNEKENS